PIHDDRVARSILDVAPADVPGRPRIFVDAPKTEGSVVITHRRDSSGQVPVSNRRVPVTRSPFGGVIGGPLGPHGHLGQQSVGPVYVGLLLALFDVLGVVWTR